MRYSLSDVCFFVNEQIPTSEINLKNYINEYKVISPNVKILFWNLEGYAKGTPLKLNDDILEISGYSDKILEVIPYIWENKNALVEKIESIKLS